MAHRIAADWLARYHQARARRPVLTAEEPGAACGEGRTPEEEAAGNDDLAAAYDHDEDIPRG
jgi:hypothetical protein